jgi:hypothetical protein
MTPTGFAEKVTALVTETPTAGSGRELPAPAAVALDYPLLAVVAGLIALAVTVLVARLLRAACRTLARLATRLATRGAAADALTWLAASIATGVAAQGMWRFFGDVLHFPPALRVLMFAFLEVAVVTSAVRARQNLRRHGSASVDGAAVWALTSLSAVLSAMHASSFPEAVFRLSAPLVAAWLWERGMAGDRHAATGQSRRIHWRLTPDRILVRLGLADPAARSSDQAATERRLARVALAARQARALRTVGASTRRQGRALARLERAVVEAVTHTRLATDDAQQRHLLAHVAALYQAHTLLDLDHPAPWQPLSVPAPGYTHAAITASAEDPAPPVPAPPGPAPTPGGPSPAAVPESAEPAPPLPSAPDPAPTAPAVRRVAKDAATAPPPAAARGLTDQQILADISTDPPSIREIKRRYAIGQSRATRIYRMATDSQRINPEDSTQPSSNHHDQKASERSLFDAIDRTPEAPQQQSAGNAGAGNTPRHHRSSRAAETGRGAAAAPSDRPN